MQRRTFLGGLAGAGAAAWLPGNPASAQRDFSGDTSFDPRLWQSDIAIINANIYTMDDRVPRAQAALVRAGRIAVVGSTAQVRHAMPRGTPVVDAGGRAVVPGFVDPHTHIDWSCMAVTRMVNLYTPAPRTVDEVLRRIRPAVDRTPAGEWIVVDGWLYDLAEKRLPTIDELDGLTSRHPLIVFNGVHQSTSNSYAARKLGYHDRVAAATATFQGDGQHMSAPFAERDAKGRPERAFDMFFRLPTTLWSVAELREGIRKEAGRIYVQGGVTTAAPMSFFTGERAAIQQLHAEGALPLRTRTYYVCPMFNDLDGILRAGVTPGFGNDMDRIGGFKFFVDMVAEFTDHPTRRDFTRASLADAITRASARGFQTLNHVLSDDGMDMVVGAVEDAQAALPHLPQLHHRVEHNRPDLSLVPRMKKAGMTFTMIASPRPITQEYEGPLGWSDLKAPLRSYIAAGIHPIFMSDKCGGEPDPVRPLVSIAAACLPIASRGTMLPGETIGFDDALRMWTIWSAQAGNQARDRGSITPGKLGDFVLLSGDPARMKPESYFDLRVDATILGGKIVHQA